MSISTEREYLLNKVMRLLEEYLQEWRVGLFTLDHAKSGIEVWISNVLVFDVCVHKPVEVKFSFWQRWRLRKAVLLAMAKLANGLIDKRMASHEST